MSPINKPIPGGVHQKISNPQMDEFLKEAAKVILSLPGAVWEIWGIPGEKNYQTSYVSPNVEKLIGYTQQEWMSSQKFGEKIIHPDDRNLVISAIRQMYVKGSGTTIVYRWVSKDGKIVWVESRCEVIKDIQKRLYGIRALSLDVTERVKANQTIMNLAAIVKNTDDAVIGWSTEGKITTWNPGAERLYGYKATEVLGGNYKVLLIPKNYDEFLELIEIAKIGESVDHLETVRCHKSGNIIDVSVTVSPVKDESGEVIGISSIERDISIEKELERRKDAFIGMASHELKTPITSLKGFTQILTSRLSAKANKHQETLHFLKKMDDQLDKMIYLIADLLDLSKIQAGQLELKKEKFDINSLLEDTIESIQGMSPKHNIIIKGKLKKLFFGDKDRIGQVITNILTNAIKYSPEASKVLIDIEEQDNKLKIKVTDFGIGISKRNLSRIFDRFFRASGSSEKTFPGLGIGLYISSEIVKRHGGKISVQSTARKGSEFTVVLPFS